MQYYDNIGTVERLVRCLIGGAVLMGIMLYILPPAMALVAVYVILTAIFVWEPLYSLSSYVYRHGLRFLQGLVPDSGSGKAPAPGV